MKTIDILTIGNVTEDINKINNSDPTVNFNQLILFFKTTKKTILTRITLVTSFQILIKSDESVSYTHLRAHET